MFRDESISEARDSIEREIADLEREYEKYEFEYNELDIETFKNPENYESELDYLVDEMESIKNSIHCLYEELNLLED